MTQSPRAPGPALRTVLLDIDGTLIDSNDAHARAWVDALRTHGYVIPFEEVRPLFLKRELPTLRPTKGARALLEHLTAIGLELVVATSSKSSEVQALLEQAGVADLIPLASSAEDGERSKPDPDIVKAALRMSKSLAARSVMVGDTPYDIEASARAKVPSIALRCGGWWNDAALRGATAIYDDPAELLARLEESPISVVMRE
jgi:HAD superfamily hydrolase (TIGR01549 family)